MRRGWWGRRWLASAADARDEIFLLHDDIHGEGDSSAACDKGNLGFELLLHGEEEVFPFRDYYLAFRVGEVVVLCVFVDGTVCVLQQRVLCLHDKLDDAGEELEDFR